MFRTCLLLFLQQYGSQPSAYVTPVTWSRQFFPLTLGLLTRPGQQPVWQLPGHLTGHCVKPLNSEAANEWLAAKTQHKHSAFTGAVFQASIRFHTQGMFGVCFKHCVCMVFLLLFFLYQPQLQAIPVMCFVKNFHQIIKLHEAILEQKREWLRPICYNFPESNTFILYP